MAYLTSIFYENNSIILSTSSSSYQRRSTKWQQLKHHDLLTTFLYMDLYPSTHVCGDLARALIIMCSLSRCPVHCVERSKESRSSSKEENEILLGSKTLKTALSFITFHNCDNWEWLYTSMETTWKMQFTYFSVMHSCNG